MYFLIEDGDLLEKYITIWNKLRADIKEELDIKFVYKINFLKTKMKNHGDEVTEFCNKESLKVDSNHNCLAVLSWDYAPKKDDNYYSQVFPKECKYIDKKSN